MILAAAAAAVSAVYYLLALVAALRQLRARDTEPRSLPPVSILKAIRGRDPEFYSAIRSHAEQDYPEFEMLFGVRDPKDPAIEDIERLAGEFPERRIRLVRVTRRAMNGKIGALADLAGEARYPVLLVNDSDIFVEPGYLRSVVGSLEDPRTGVVTCLYRARGESAPSRWEALGHATEFVPSVLVARLLGMRDFALGSTMVFRAEDIRRIGGFEAVGDYLADDYQLGRHVSALGYRVELVKTVVETDLGGETWGEIWRHQLRWARTIRVSRPGGYVGYVITHATLWSLVAMACGAWRIGIAALLIRVVAGAAAVAALRDRKTTAHIYLMPARDLWGVAVWVAGLFGDTVEWRGQRLKLSREGKIQPVEKRDNKGR